jgi:hypothetical protein
MEKYYYPIDIPQDEKEMGGKRISSYKKNCNIPMMISAIVYFIALFLPVVSVPVMDSGPIGIPTFVLSLSMLNLIWEAEDFRVLFIGLLFAMNLVMTASFLINTVLFAVSEKVKRAGLMFAQNIFCFLTIPILYPLAIYLCSPEYDFRFLRITRIGYFLISSTAFITLICFILVGIYSIHSWRRDSRFSRSH